MTDRSQIRLTFSEISVCLGKSTEEVDDGTRAVISRRCVASINSSLSGDCLNLMHQVRKVMAEATYLPRRGERACLRVVVRYEDELPQTFNTIRQFEEPLEGATLILK